MVAKTKTEKGASAPDDVATLKRQIAELQRQVAAGRHRVRTSAQQLAGELRNCVRTGLRTVWRDKVGRPLARHMGGTFRDADFAE